MRIEDLDPPREIPGASVDILHCLQAHGLQWDGDVWYQSQRSAIYQTAIAQLSAANLVFYCTCSRADLVAHAGIYSGHCRNCAKPPAIPYAIRLRVDASDIAFIDRIQGACVQNMSREVGDFVLFRKEGLAAYQLAVVTDDAAQGVTHIVRGCDLLDSTARQIFLQHCLHLPTPSYAHIPVIANSAGQKLSKQTFAMALDANAAIPNLLAALEFLAQPAPATEHCVTVDKLLEWAIAHWQLEHIPRRPWCSGDALPSSCRRLIA